MVTIYIYILKCHINNEQSKTYKNETALPYDMY